eukprot:scaffold672_cov268-Pinguiococcus_pyrenoidosus.AAC.16
MRPATRGDVDAELQRPRRSRGHRTGHIRSARHGVASHRHDSVGMGHQSHPSCYDLPALAESHRRANLRPARRALPKRIEPFVVLRGVYEHRSRGSEAPVLISDGASHGQPLPHEAQASHGVPASHGLGVLGESGSHSPCGAFR